MLKTVKKIFESKFLKLVFSVVLIYFAFSRIDVSKLFNEIKNVPHWLVLINIFIRFLLVAMLSVRWSLLLFPEIKIKTILTFTRASILADFYTLFFSTAVVGEVAKWIVIDNKYPEISKTKILASVILDRFIGFSTFVIFGLISIIIGKNRGLIIPEVIFYLLFVLTIACLVIYFIVYYFDVSKLFPKFTLLHKLDDAFELFKGKNMMQVVKCLLVSVLSEIFWMLQIWWLGNIFGASLSFLTVFIFIPITSMILILPISVGGFGAREELYLLFLAKYGTGESILLLSTFLGILGVITSLLGGVLLFYDDRTKKRLKTQT